eukprot:1145760-Pelagomonas_calceolata.AAC.2
MFPNSMREAGTQQSERTLRNETKIEVYASQEAASRNGPLRKGSQLEFEQGSYKTARKTKLDTARQLGKSPGSRCLAASLLIKKRRSMREGREKENYAGNATIPASDKGKKLTRAEKLCNPSTMIRARSSTQLDPGWKLPQESAWWRRCSELKRLGMGLHGSVPTSLSRLALIGKRGALAAKEKEAFLGNENLLRQREHSSHCEGGGHQFKKRGYLGPKHHVSSPPTEEKINGPLQGCWRACLRLRDGS